MHVTAFRKNFYGVLLATLGAGSIFAANAEDEFQTQSGAGPPATMTFLYNTESVLGKDLICPSGERAGRIIDVLTDEIGQVRAVIVDFGGFLGVGSRRIAIDWLDLRFGSGGNTHAVAVDLSREQLSRAPQVKPGQPVVVIRRGQPLIVISSRHPAWYRTEARK